MSVTRPESTGAALKASLDAARGEFRASIARGTGGRGALERYADRVDGLIRQLFTDAGPYDGPIAIIALGGYGRRHLCLHSDIDLLLLFGDGIGPAEERFVNSFLNPLWDLGVVVGHQVRNIEDLRQLETDNPEFLLALLDARPVAGARSVFERFGVVFHQAETHAFILRSLLGLIDERHARFNATLYQLEPDVKDAPGALRDLTATRTIALLTDPLLLRRGPADAARFDDAEDFLLRVRSTLHLECGRNQNVLSHELQERTAEMLGYPGAEPRQRVEKLMSDYFRHARIVSRSLEWARRTAPAPVGANLGLSRDGVRFIDPVQAARNPSSWLGAFQAALDSGNEVSEEALSCIQQHVDRYRADDFFVDAQDRAALLRFLKPRPGLYARLSQMHDCGLLGRVFPEFQAISWRVVRDFYHKYTVDEHTLLTIRNLERLVTTEVGDRMRFRSILSDLQEPELLVVALLFHDVGKWREADHAQESVRLAQSMLDRLELPDEERATVEFLIREHLQMSQVAFRRDSEDPHVAARFAELVGTEEQLKLLCLMTLADVGAVSPDTLTPWKEDLLWRVYVDTYNRLTLGYADQLLDKDPAGLAVLIAGRPADISEQELVTFLEGLPRRYLSTFGLSAVYRHVRLARDIHPDEVHTFLEKHDDVWELTLVTLDKPFLFSNISGVLSYFGMDIHRGQAMTTPNGLVLDVFEFSDDEDFLKQNAAATTEISKMLERAVAGSVDVTALLRGRMHSVLHRVRHHHRRPPVAHFDNEHSRKYTVLEIVADDAPGLLHRISRVISSQGCDVHLVLISTEGKRAIDVLHITRNGAKLSEADQAALAAELQQVLEAGE
jgi:[protein-PII] uridylyltransferase